MRGSPWGGCSLVADGHAANRAGEISAHYRTNPVGESYPCYLRMTAYRPGLCDRSDHCCLLRVRHRGRGLRSAHGSGSIGGTNLEEASMMNDASTPIGQPAAVNPPAS